LPFSQCSRSGKEIYKQKETVSVGLKVIDQGIIGKKLSKNEIFTVAKKNIESAQKQTKLLIEKGFIPPYKIK